MGRAPATERAVQDLVARCHVGLDSMALQGTLVERIGAVLAVDAVFCASVDPSTLLFTGAVTREISADAAGRFLANEFFEDDVNKFRMLAAGRPSVDWLDHVTGTRRAESARYREIMAPMGLGDELRAAFRSGGQCWGFLCLHREDGPLGFTPADARKVARISTHVGEGLRRALLVGSAETDTERHAPGVLVLDADGGLLATTTAGECWLWELSAFEQGEGLPLAVEAVVARLAAIRAGRTDLLPHVRVRTRSGGWAVIHASEMVGPGGEHQVAVVVEPARAAEVAPLFLLAYGLTPREAEVAQAAVQGHTNKAVARTLQISEHTVEDHLKSVFAKVGVASRGELTARIFSVHYAPG